MAFAAAPVVGADVRVSVYGPHGWPLVDVPAATNRYGVFPAAVPSLSSVRVTVSGGTINGQPFPGHLSRDVVLTDPAHQIVVVNPVTTLVSRLLDRRPELKLDEAEALVRRFLGLPANYSMGLALRQSSGYVSRFSSPVAFMTEAQAAGGLDAFAHLLLLELASDSAIHPFPQPKLLGDTGSSAVSTIQAGLEAGILDYASSIGLYSLTGWAISLTGSSNSGADSAAIDALLQSLADLQSSIDALSNQVAQLSNLVQSTATQTQYNTIVVPAQTLELQVNGVESDLSYFAQACPPLPGGSTPTTPDAYCTNEKVSVTAELNDVTIQQAYVTMEGYVGDNPTIGFRGMLHLYSLWLAQSKPFFRPADSTDMQNLYNYWDAALTQAANLKIELLHQNGAQGNPGGQQQLTDFMGNPTLNPPSKGTFQVNEAANLKLMFPAVPVGTVINTRDHTMWATDYPVDSTEYCIVNYGLPPPQASMWNSPITSASSVTWNGITGWISPSLPEIQSLIQGWTGPNPNSWLTAQTEAVAPDSPLSPGFANLLPDSPGYGCGSAGFVWTSTPTGSYYSYNGVHYPEYYVMRLDTGTTNVPSNYNIAGLNPRNWIFLKRSLGQGEQYFWYN